MIVDPAQHDLTVNFSQRHYPFLRSFADGPYTQARPRAVARKRAHPFVLIIYRQLLFCGKQYGCRAMPHAR